jgi:PTH1 family peptidyl-tRNA hydrolase
VIQLIVGLGNPGAEYEHTRHNAGAWFVARLADDANTSFRLEKKFHGALATLDVSHKPLYLLQPTTFMNHSGRSVSALASYYKITPSAILVAHDDLDLPSGTVRIKRGGGDGGHNGLRDVTSALHTPDYFRLRIGIGHPGHRDRVLSYVLSAASKHEQELIIESLVAAEAVLPLLVDGQIEQAMTRLHTKTKE